jgi:hypothetical protein
MNHRQKLALLTIFTLILLVGCSKAADTPVSPTGGQSDQKVINDAINAVAKSGGGTVYLKAGTYFVDGPVIVKSNIMLAGDPNAIIKVYSGSSQWFTGSIGIISNTENLHDVIICGFQIDGSVTELPPGYHQSRSDTAHDCERCILFAGDSGNQMNNISIHDMTLYDSFSDGIYIRFCDNVQIYNNFISNTQHEGVYMVCCRYSLVENNRIAGITSDCMRFDNNQNTEIRFNTCWSYDGSHASNTYMHGENGIQVGNTGASHGYDGRDKPFFTLNVYVHDNQFINNGLNAILIGGDVKDDNVYFKDNKVIGHEQLETSGFPIDIIGNYSYEHPPSLQTSKKVFSSIFDILNVDFQNSGYTNQQDESIQYSVQKTTEGDIAGGIKILGFRNQIIIDNKTYIPDENSAIVKYTAVIANGLDFWNREIDKTDPKVTISIKNGVAKARLDVTMRWYTVSSITRKDGKTTIKKDFHTSTASFNDSCQAPDMLQKAQNITAYVDVYPSQTFPKFVIHVPHNEMTQRIEYKYENIQATNTFLIGEKQTDDKGVEHVFFARCNRWDGNFSSMADEFIINGPFNPKELSVTYYSPYETVNVNNIKVTVHDLEKHTWKEPMLGLIARLIFMLFILFFIYRVVSL